MSVLKKKIKKVLGPRKMSSKKISDGVIAKYPEYFIRKICKYNNGKKALDQIKGEVTSIVFRDPDFSTDRDGSPNLHYLSK